MSTKKHYYFSRVLLEETIGARPWSIGNEHFLPISFYVVKQKRYWHDDLTDFSCVSSGIAQERTNILFQYRDHIELYTVFLASYLSTMGVPQEEHPTILEKILHMVHAAVKGEQMIVLIADVSVRLSGCYNDHGNIANHIREFPHVYFPVNKSFYEIRDVDYHGISTTDRIAWESFEACGVKFIPATKSSIEGLPRVRLDSLEEATIEQDLSCSICMDGIAQGGVDQLITPLPCSHLYHADCIIRWLQTSHVCPLCRYPQPSVEDCEPSSSERTHIVRD